MTRFQKWKLNRCFRFIIKFATQYGVCANRNYWIVPTKNGQLEITLRNTTEPDLYSREEVYELLKTVREQERISGWKCPEPELDGKETQSI